MFYYDVFVIYNFVGKDLEFVKEFVGKMEVLFYNLKFCIFWRDDLFGGFCYEVFVYMIVIWYEMIIKIFINLLKFDLLIVCMGCFFRC